MPKGYNADGSPQQPPQKKPTKGGRKGPYLFVKPVINVLEDSDTTETAYLEQLVLRDQCTGLFNRREWSGLVDAFNGLKVTGDIPSRDLLLAEMEDASTLEQNDKLHRYPIFNLLEKIRHLTDRQAECVVQVLILFRKRKIADGLLLDFLDEYAAADGFESHKIYLEKRINVLEAIRDYERVLTDDETRELVALNKWWEEARLQAMTIWT